MDELANALEDYDAAHNKLQRARAAAALAEVVRLLLFQHESEEEEEEEEVASYSSKTAFFPRTKSSFDMRSSVHTSRSVISSVHTSLTGKDGSFALGLNLNRTLSLKYEGIVYPSAQNAFQAQKCADIEERKNFGNIDVSAALTAGRRCAIDPTKWDAGREELMYKILKVQAEEHDEMRQVLIDMKDQDIKEDCLFNEYWGKTLPTIWKALGHHFAQHKRASVPPASWVAKKQKAA